MIQSMTGFGKSTCQAGGKSLSVEVRALNSKALDINMKLAPAYRDREQELRGLIAGKLERGKVELVIGADANAAAAGLSVNKPLLAQYYRELLELSEELGAPPSAELLPSLLRLPEVLKPAGQEADEQEWDVVRACVAEALDQAGAFRLSEGAHLEADLGERIRTLRELLGQIPAHEEKRMLALKARLQRALSELAGTVQADPGRFEQELIFYLEKLDISEEKVRLTKHLAYFEETMAGGESQGKKLGFISQEMGREINTIGSKANDADIQRLVVQMKDELEKIKEQLMNVL
jgi:uncharacterized protein (TIGR00255 family)